MKSRIAALFLVVCLLLPSVAFAASGFASASATMTSDAIAGPGAVTLSVAVKAADMNLTSVTIIHGSQELGSIGSLSAGATASKSVSVSVSQSEFDAGSLSLDLEYEDVNGVTGLKTVSATIKKDTSQSSTTPTTTSQTQTGTPSATVTVEASSTSVKQGDDVKLSYVVTNTGSVIMTYVELSESALGKIGQVDSLAPGEKATFQYTVKSIASGFTAKPRVTYIYNSQTYSATGNSVTINVATAKLDVSLTASPTEVGVGEPVVLTGTVTNKGSIKFTSVTVSDKTLGALEKWTNVAAGDTKTFRKTITPTDSAVYQLTVVAVDADGRKYTYSSKSVTVKVANNPVPVTISLIAETDTVQLSSPGMVSFDIEVQNLCNKTLNNVRITDQDDKLVQTIAELPTGNISLTYEYMVNQTVSFIFTATVTVDGITSNFRSAPVEVVILSQSLDTSPTEATTPVVVTPAPTAPSQNGGTSTLTKILIVVIVVIAVVVAALIALVIYGNSIRPESRTRNIGRSRGRTTGRGSGHNTGRSTRGRRR